MKIGGKNNHRRTYVIEITRTDPLSLGELGEEG